LRIANELQILYDGPISNQNSKEQEEKPSRLADHPRCQHHQQTRAQSVSQCQELLRGHQPIHQLAGTERHRRRTNRQRGENVTPPPALDPQVRQMNRQ